MNNNYKNNSNNVNDACKTRKSPTRQFESNDYILNQVGQQLHNYVINSLHHPVNHLNTVERKTPVNFNGNQTRPPKQPDKQTKSK